MTNDRLYAASCSFSYFLNFSGPISDTYRLACLDCVIIISNGVAKGLFPLFSALQIRRELLCYPSIRN